MATKKKLLQAAAGVGGAGLDVDEVFATHLYVGTGDSTQNTITNGIDLAGEGGFVWTKSRTNTYNNTIGDSESGLSYYLYTNTTVGHTDATSVYYNSFNSNGYTVGASGVATANELNNLNQDFVSWTWRKAPKFFDCVQYTGNGTAGRTVSHNLGSVPGMMIIKRTDSGAAWYVYHREMSNTDTLRLNTNAAKSTNQTNFLNSTTPTDTEFTLGSEADVNGSGGTFIAYLFAHNDGDGEFGPDGDQDIIHCGTYTTDASTGTATVDIGFEPQFIMAKRTDFAQDWAIFDVSRGIFLNNDYIIKPNQANAESSAGNQYNVTPTGFTCQEHNTSATYIFMAIRRGSLFEPENVDDVFSQEAYSGNSVDDRNLTSGFQTDLAIVKRRNSAANWFLADRIRGERSSLYRLFTNLPNPQDNTGTNRLQEIALQDGIKVGTDSDVNVSGATYVNYQWKRAPKFFDMVRYVGGSGADTINHNLGVAPSMIWVKNLDRGSSVPARGYWNVYHSGTSTGYYILNESNALITSDAVSKFGNGSSLVAPTDSTFTVADDYTVGRSGDKYIAYLWGEINGISKAGAISHTSGSATNVDCGFSNGARFVILKRYDAASDWWVFDTERGIVTGNDGRLFFNNTNAENTGADEIDPYSAGFSIASGRATGDYIFYAIAT